MNDTENISEENVLPCGEETKKLSCGIFLELFKDNELEFNVIWDSDEDIFRLATLINAVRHSDLIMNQVEQMQTEDPEAINTIKKYVKILNNKPVLSPLEVCRNANREE